MSILAKTSHNLLFSASGVLLVSGIIGVHSEALKKCYAITDQSCLCLFFMPLLYFSQYDTETCIKVNCVWVLKRSFKKVYRGEPCRDLGQAVTLSL